VKRFNKPVEEETTRTIVDGVRKLTSSLAGQLVRLKPRDKGRLGRLSDSCRP